MLDSLHRGFSSPLSCLVKMLAKATGSQMVPVRWVPGLQHPQLVTDAIEISLRTSKHPTRCGTGGVVSLCVTFCLHAGKPYSTADKSWGGSHTWCTCHSWLLG